MLTQSRNPLISADAGLTNDAVRLARSHAPHLVAEIMLSASAPPSLPSPVNNTVPAFSRAGSTASAMAVAGTAAGAKGEQKLQLIMMQVVMSEVPLSTAAGCTHLPHICRLNPWSPSGISPARSASILRCAHDHGVRVDYEFVLRWLFDVVRR